MLNSPLQQVGPTMLSNSFDNVLLTGWPQPGKLGEFDELSKSQ